MLSGSDLDSGACALGHYGGDWIGGALWALAAMLNHFVDDQIEVASCDVDGDEIADSLVASQR